MGHSVTLFEKSPKIGGLLRYGIPDFKLEKWVLDRRIEQMKAEGVRFEVNVDAGVSISAEELKRNFDAILLTMGAGEPRDLKVPGRELQGVHFALEYLVQSNRFVSKELKPEQMIHAKGKTVLVSGGGDTGSDCVGTANRQGAKKVYQFEILPKPEEWSKPWNPEWPNWPKIFRSSTSHEEGCERDWSIITKMFGGANGQVHEVHCARVQWELDKATGQYTMKEISASEFVLKTDLVLLAMGFVHVEHSRLLTDLGIQFDPRGNVSTDGDYASSVKSVFAAGDTVRGASLVVWAISQGRQAAQAVDAYLRS
jgi:glutamate synthase (NADPH/NADH) small chain